MCGRSQPITAEKPHSHKSHHIESRDSLDAIVTKQFLLLSSFLEILEILRIFVLYFGVFFYRKGKTSSVSLDLVSSGFFKSTSLLSTSK